MIGLTWGDDSTARNLQDFVSEQPRKEMLYHLLKTGVLSEKQEKRISYLLESMEAGTVDPSIFEVKAALYATIVFFANSGHFESAFSFSSVFSNAENPCEYASAIILAIRTITSLEVGALQSAKNLYEGLRKSSEEIPSGFLAQYLNNLGIAARYFEPEAALGYFQESLEAAQDPETKAMIRSNMLLYLYTFGSDLEDSLFVSDHEPESIAHGIDELQLMYLLEKPSVIRARAPAEKLRKANLQEPVRQNSVQTHAYLGHYFIEARRFGLAERELSEAVQILNKQFSVFRFGEAAFLASRLYGNNGNLARSLATLLIARECLESNRLFCRFHKSLYERVLSGLETRLPIGREERDSCSKDVVAPETLISLLVQAACLDNGEQQLFLEDSVWSELFNRKSSTVHFMPAISQRIICGISKGYEELLRKEPISLDEIICQLPGDSDFAEPRNLERLNTLAETLAVVFRLE